MHTDLWPQAKILIVDDEESIRMTFSLFLHRAGYQNIRTAASIREALDHVAEAAPDLVISDIVLKGESGVSLLEQLHRQDIDCPVVMVTGFPNLDTAARAVRLGAFDYLAKPVNKDTLLQLTRQALKHRRLDLEKKRLAAKNEAYRQYLEAIFRSVQDIMIAVNPDLQIIKINETARNWLRRRTGSETIPRDLMELDRLFGLPCLQDARRVLESGQEIREHRVECSLDDGQRKVFSMNGSPIKDREDTFHGVLLVARDITMEQPLPSDSCRVRFHGYVGISPAMQEVYSLIENVGKFDTTVLVTGESGTGKELAAQALHAESYRKDKPLIKVDCASIPEDLLESELFGHRQGAFTGAQYNRTGRIQQADGGTLFLDEIGDISPKMQLRLLRFLQEKTFYPVGGDTPIHVDTRVIAATNVDLRSKVSAGSFREDLYYRLKVIEISLPPLRERRQGIPLLANHFLKEFQKQFGHNITSISDQAIDLLTSYHWPGNVRELKHVMERACVLCQGPTITRDHLPDEISRPDRPPSPARQESGQGPGSGTRQANSSPGAGIRPPEESPNHDAIQELLAALRQTGGNKAKAARLLGIDRSTLYRRLRRHGISPGKVTG